MAANFIYSGDNGPKNTVAPAHLNKFVDVRRLTVYADTANIYAGMIVDLTGTTQTSDMTECGAHYGGADTEGFPCIVEIVEHDPNFATTTETPEFPNRLPNTTAATVANHKHAENGTIIVIPLQLSMCTWVLGSEDASFDAVAGTLYITAAAGLMVAAPTAGTAVDVRAWAARSLATTTNQNWFLVQWIGLIAYDAS